MHLASMGRLGHDDVARRGYTQQGIVDALGIPQGTVAKVLVRLEAADVVEVDRRHVSGEARRLKVYRLTGLGESVARDLRSTRRQPTSRSTAISRGTAGYTEHPENPIVPGSQGETSKPPR